MNPTTSISGIMLALAQSGNAQQIRYLCTLVTGVNAGTVTLLYATSTGGQGSMFRKFSHLTITKK
jgi:hypothetical protein